MVSVSFDWSLLVQIINFILLMLVLNAFLYKPILKIIKKREDLFDTFRQRATSAKNEIEESEIEQKKFKTKVFVEGVKIQTDLKSEGQEKEKQILSKAQADSADRLETARQKLSAQVDSTKKTLEAEAQNIAREMAGKILGRTL
jgi:F-type H+-transporting ATPase subunit b